MSLASKWSAILENKSKMGGCAISNEEVLEFVGENAGEGSGVAERDDAKVALDSDLRRGEGFGGNRVDSTLLTLSTKVDEVEVEVEDVVVVGVSMRI